MLNDVTSQFIQFVRFFFILPEVLLCNVKEQKILCSSYFQGFFAIAPLTNSTIETIAQLHEALHQNYCTFSGFLVTL